jgi:hypothetical protein
MSDRRRQPTRTRRPAAPRAWRTVAALFAAALLIAGLAELHLPGLIEQRVRERLEREFGGEVTSLRVEGSALGTLLGGPERVVFEIEDAAGAGGFEALGEAEDVEARFGTLSLPGLQAQDVLFVKDDERFTLRMNVPEVLSGPNGRMDLELSAGHAGTLVGAVAGPGVRVEIVASDGDVVARPGGLGPLGPSIASVTLVSLPSLRVDDLGAASAGEGVELNLTGGVAA